MSIGVRAPYLGVHIPQGVSFDPTTSYANAGATGDRRGIVHTLDGAGFDIGGIYYLINGSTADEARMDAAVAGRWLRFDFGFRHVIDEVRWVQSTTSTHGIWKVQQSNDGSAWVDTNASVTLGGATTQLIPLTGAPTTYRYLRLLGVSGNANLGTWMREIEFKISAPENALGTAWVSGNRTASITITKSAGLTLASGALSNWVDGSTSTGFQVNNSITASGNWLQFDFGSSKLVNAALWKWASNGTWGSSTPTWKWQGSPNASSWTDIGAAFNVPGPVSAITGQTSVFMGSGLWQCVMYGDLPGNIVPYRYYQLLGVSGFTTADNLYEIEFRIL